jgi:hypothetical protein
MKRDEAIRAAFRKDNPYDDFEEMTLTEFERYEDEFDRAMDAKIDEAMGK